MRRRNRNGSEGDDVATTGYETEDFLREHIPYRLEMLDTYCTAILLSTLREHPELTIGQHFILPTKYGYRQSKTDQLLNLALETGLITFRLLMEFLGVKASTDGKRLIEASPRDTDFHVSRITDQDGLALPSVTPSRMNGFGDFTCSTLATNISFNVEAMFASIYQQANKTAAHLVEKDRSYHGLDNYLASLLLRSLVEVLVYDRLNKRKLLENLGVWSNELLHPSVLEEHDRAGSVAFGFVRGNIAL